MGLVGDSRFKTSHAQAGTRQHVLLGPNVKAHAERNRQASHINRPRRHHRRPAAAATYQGPPVGPLAYLALHMATTRKGL